MINLYLFLTYIGITAGLFIVSVWAKIKWIPVLLGCLMAFAVAVSIFLEEVSLEGYFNWITVLFWILMGISLALASVYSLTEMGWAGIVSSLSMAALIVIIVVDLLVFGVFPLLPGFGISTYSLIE